MASLPGNSLAVYLGLTVALMGFAAYMTSQATAQTTEFIRKLRDELGITVLLIEHDMRVVMGISDHIIVLDYGRKISDGTPEFVRNDPAVIRAYLGEEEEGEAARP